MTRHDYLWVLTDNNLIHPNHHGFLSNHSTATALLHLYDLWIQAIDSGQFSAALLLDLSAGFDVVSHPILLDKLAMYGLDELAVSWFRSYVSDRQQCVLVESALSDPKPVSFGVPQGSILGPELYNYNSNDLFLFVLLQIANYADDNSPFCTAETIPHVINNLEADAKNLLW